MIKKLFITCACSALAICQSGFSDEPNTTTPESKPDVVTQSDSNETQQHEETLAHSDEQNEARNDAEETVEEASLLAEGEEAEESRPEAEEPQEVILCNSCADGKCPPEMIERLRKKKIEERENVAQEMRTPGENFENQVIV